MSGRSTEMTDNVGGKVALLGTIILAMATVTAILAYLVLIVSQGTVKRSEFTKLASLVIVLAFGSGSSSFDNLVNQVHTSVNLILGLCHDKTVEILFGVICICIRSALALLDTSLASNTNLGTTLPLHPL
jgi:hypothetical protein